VLLAAAYLSAVLGGAMRGMTFAGALAATYGAVYVVLIAETHALLMGAVLLFAVLAVLMLVTRRIDWYRLGVRKVEA
jgi:inner membrane protein